MSAYTIRTESSPLEQVGRGIATGFRWFFRLLATTAAFAVAGVVLYKFGAAESGEDAEAVHTHHDIRRNIAIGVNGRPASATTAPPVQPWKTLVRSNAFHTDDHGFDSRVEVRAIGGTTVYRVLIGPYDPDLSRALKSSSGWVNLKLLQ